VTTAERLDALQASIDYQLPEDFRLFLMKTGGGEGFWGEGHVYLGSPQDIEDMAHRYGITELIPDLVLIGSDGGGESFAIDRATGRYVMTDLIGTSPRSGSTPAGPSRSSVISSPATRDGNT
jgi:hypothetical protein